MSLDGVSPKNAVCTHCGFHLGGIPIKGVSVTCPECGQPVVFELAPPAHPSPRRALAGPILLALLAALIVMAMISNGHARPLAIAAVPVGMLVLFLGLRLLRRMTVG